MKNFIKTFSEFITEERDQSLEEAKVSFGKMNFTFFVTNDRKGTALQFLPDSKTLDSSSKNEQVDSIMEAISKAMPNFAECLWFESGSDMAGLTFRVDVYKLTEILAKKLK